MRPVYDAIAIHSSHAPIDYPSIMLCVALYRRPICYPRGVYPGYGEGVFFGGEEYHRMSPLPNFPSKTHGSPLPPPSRMPL